MRSINLKDVTQKVRDLFIEACENIPENVLTALKNAVNEEESPLGKQVIEQIIKNDLNFYTHVIDSLNSADIFYTYANVPIKNNIDFYTHVVDSLNFQKL